MRTVEHNTRTFVQKKQLRRPSRFLSAIISGIGERLVHGVRLATSMGSNDDRRFSDASLAAELVEPAILQESSSSLNWRSGLLRIYHGIDESPAFETQPTSDLKIVVNLKGQSELRCLKRGLWRTGVKAPGSLGVTAAGDTSRLRWRSLTPDGFTQAHLHMPMSFLEEDLDERRRAGRRTHASRLSTLAAEDAAVAAIVVELVQGMRSDASDMYAEERLRFLSARLMVAADEWQEETERDPGVMGEARLKKAMEFMSADLSADHSLGEIAREAGISLFHFVRMFRRATGLPPYAYLTELRLDAARRMLERSDVPVAEVGRLVGYRVRRNFIAAFSRRYGTSPGAWRRDNRTNGSQQ